MARISLNSNISSLTTQRRLGDATRELSSTFERLSSGFRINRAADDAAGLAIADNLNADNRVFAQGIRNLNDGLSLLNVADGALTELSSIVVRIRELAEQSANGTLSNKQREALDQEAQELSDEFTRIAQTTEYNGLKLFDGSLGELSLQAGYGERGAVKSSLGGAIGDGSFTDRISYATLSGIELTNVGDFDNNGTLDIVAANTANDALEILFGNGDGSFSNLTSFAVGDFATSVGVGDFNNDGNLDLVSSDGIGDSISVTLGDGQGGFSQSVSYAAGDTPYKVVTGDLNGDGNIDIVSANYFGDSISVFLGEGDGTFSLSASSSIGDGPREILLEDLNGDGILDIAAANRAGNSVTVRLGSGDGTFESAETYSVTLSPNSISAGDFNGDGNLDLVSAEVNSTTTSVLFGNGDGTFADRISFSIGTGPSAAVAGDFNGDSIDDIAVTAYSEANVTVLIADGTGSFSSIQSYAAGTFPRDIEIGDFNGDGVLDIFASNPSSGVSVLLGNTTSGVAPLLDFSLDTKVGALQAMAPLDRKIEQLALQKGTIGAFQSRVEVAINNLQISSTNVQAAESRIRDADVAFEAAKLTRLNILQQAGAAVLVQANSQPALALQLLNE